MLDGFDNTNAFLRQNIPGLIEDTSVNKQEIQEIKVTLPKHAEKISEMQKKILSLDENFSNEDEKVVNLNKLVTNLFGQVYDMSEN